ncbi:MULTISPECIES: translation initiation factor 2 [Pseudomonas]|uniref:translation initiation factor 2 n=1 Tax=Pseudomonas TaxID=286 RepID=UPI0015D4B613|nr:MULTISPECIES: translation initiation factor 2 [Pseudomonas]MBP0940417.1 translation initiation factor 2 [Pseudomonas alliivorans]MEE4375698.1 translation initiation factor 2 [Pseudomonas alliivorans]MEE4625554.1 translation initiation factor 2 [Pseudomonas alliivorans]MEE4675109.1 translation initiation factor 2 [Pseudomonas alliivorans]MEE4683043.1 translation initiation factor 2 [Pseudomonas alliivorans]
MNMFRCLGLSVIVLLGACDARETPVPKPKTESGAPAAVQAPVAAEARSTVDSPRESVVTDSASDKAPVTTHELMPNIPVKPVVAGKEASQPVAPRPIHEVAAPARSTGRAVTTKPATGKREVTAKAGKEVKAKDVRLNRPKLDLSLPPEMVKALDPPANVITAKRKPILPQMFGSKDSPSDSGPFELNGRLLSNEMQLQMRNDNRRDVEGAALDFKFHQ